jgi:hypothetical protein
MKAALAGFAVSILETLPLLEQLTERHVATGKNTKVTVKRHDPLVFVERFGDAYGDGFLTDAAEPLGDFSLTEQDEHLLFNQSGKQDGAIQFDEGIVVDVFSVKLHGREFLH